MSFEFCPGISFQDTEMTSTENFKPSNQEGMCKYLFFWHRQMTS